MVALAMVGNNWSSFNACASCSALSVWFWSWFNELSKPVFISPSLAKNFRSILDLVKWLAAIAVNAIVKTHIIAISVPVKVSINQAPHRFLAGLLAGLLSVFLGFVALLKPELRSP